MTLKEIEPADLSFVYQMNYLAGYKNSGSDHSKAISFEQAQQEDGFKKYIENWGRAGDAGYIALNGTQPVGAAWYRLMQRNTDPEPRHIISIGVAEHAQGTGVGSLLLPRLIERATEEDIPSLGLTVLKTNEAGIHLYQKIGFKPTGFEAETEFGTILHMEISTLPNQ